jgi:uncharacterized protein (DUF927 family)
MEPLYANFLKIIVADRLKHIKRIRDHMTQLFNEQLPAGSATEVGRALQRFVAVAAVGDYASFLGITGWESGEAIWAERRCFQDWLEARGGTGQSDTQAGLRQVKSFLESHGASRFQSVAPILDKDSNPVFERVINRAGYYRLEPAVGKNPCEKLFLIFPEVFQREVCSGFDAQSVARELWDQGLLIKGDGKNWTRRESVPDLPRPRFYVVSGRILEWPWDKEDKDRPKDVRRT